MYLLKQRTFVKMAYLLLPLVLYSCLKTLIVWFRHASIILIPFPPSTHPSDPLLFFLLAWTVICGEKSLDTLVFDRKRVPV